MALSSSSNEDQSTTDTSGLTADISLLPSAAKAIDVIPVLCMGRRCKLTLNDEVISVQVEESSLSSLQPSVGFTVPLEDVFGLQVDKLPISSLINTCKAELFTYEKLKSTSPTSSMATSGNNNNNNQRKLIKRELLFNDYGDFGDNCKVASEWRKAIQSKRMKRCRQVFVNTPERVDKPIEPLRLLVIINPFSGKKKSLKLYNTVALPLFEAAGTIIVQELITERQGHAREFIKTFDLSTITGIVMASGDGILYEVINGLMERPDWESAIKTPLGLLPTGSGNALVTSQLYETNEQGGDALVSAVFQIINGGIQSHDIASVITETSHMYMGVVINWGITGTVDIESEKFRFLGGELRYFLSALMCIAVKKVYHGRLSYLPIEEEEIEGRRGEGEVEGGERGGERGGEGGEGEEVGGEGGGTEEGRGGVGEQGGGGGERGVEMLSEGIDTQDDIRTDRHTNAVSPNTSATPSSASTVTPSDTSATHPSSNIRPIPSLSLSDPIPQNWKTIEGNFIVFVGLMCSHIADTTPGHLNMRTNRGEQWIVYTTDNVTRKQLFNGMSESGGDNTVPNYHTVRTKEYRLTPLSPGIISIDGERVDYGPLHVQVHPGMVRLFTRKFNT